MFGGRSEASRENGNLGEKEITSLEEVKQIPSDSCTRTYVPDGAAWSAHDENASCTGVTDTNTRANSVGVTCTDVDDRKQPVVSGQCTSTHNDCGSLHAKNVPGTNGNENGRNALQMGTTATHNDETGAHASYTSNMFGQNENSGVANYSNPLTP